MAKEGGIGLEDLIYAIRAAIEKSQDRLSASQKDPVLYLDSAEVEILVTVSETTEGTSGVKVNVLTLLSGELGAKQSAASQSAHRLKIVLKPAATDGSNKVAVGGRRTPVAK